MPPGITPDMKEPFSDSDGNPRNAAVFQRHAGIKGTIILFLGGYAQEASSFIRVRTKGTGTVNGDERRFIKEMRALGWRIVLLEDGQAVKPDGTVANEYWIEEYIDHWNSKWPGKNFTVGHSAGAYVAGLHIRHFRDGKASSVWANCIISYTVKLGVAKKKTDFIPTDFAAKNTIFLSGSEALENSGVYRKTKELKDIAFASGHRHGWEVLDASHEVFKKACCSQNCGNKRAVTLILNDWFTKYPSLPNLPRRECAISIPGAANPAGS